LADYKVLISASTEEDLLSILRYISETLREPPAAKRIYTTIKERILSLHHMPDRHGAIIEVPFAQMGIRKLFVENYTVFYVIDGKAKTVHIVRVLYNRREWQHLLDKQQP
jgi:toxin ParE1/3/4